MHSETECIQGHPRSVILI